MVELLHVPESHQDLHVHFRHRKHFYKNNSSQTSLFVTYECTPLNHFAKELHCKCSQKLLLCLLWMSILTYTGEMGSLAFFLEVHLPGKV